MWWVPKFKCINKQYLIDRRCTCVRAKENQCKMRCQSIGVGKDFLLLLEPCITCTKYAIIIIIDSNLILTFIDYIIYFMLWINTLQTMQMQLLFVGRNKWNIPMWNEYNKIWNLKKFCDANVLWKNKLHFILFLMENNEHSISMMYLLEMLWNRFICRLLDWNIYKSEFKCYWTLWHTWMRWKWIYFTRHKTIVTWFAEETRCLRHLQ